MKILTHPFKPKDTRWLHRLLTEQAGTVVYPTETYYALGCAAHSSTAVNKVFELKQRDRSNPLLVLIDSWEMLETYAAPLPPTRLEILRRFWPGPLTAVLPTGTPLAPELNRAGSTLAFRMTTAPAALDLIRAAALPIVGTSANISAEAPISKIETAIRRFDHQVDLVVDGGETPGKGPSTVIDLSLPHSIPILRPGVIALPDILNGVPVDHAPP